MIAKQVPMKSVKKSDFAELVKYITNAQQKAERVGGVTVTNCQSDRPDAAIIEVINTQVQNTRAESDKTYHLIVSFRGDEPDETTLKAIEARICEGRSATAIISVSVPFTTTPTTCTSISPSTRFTPPAIRFTRPTTTTRPGRALRAAGTRLRPGARQPPGAEAWRGESRCRYGTSCRR
jgi:hypothetical protein